MPIERSSAICDAFEFSIDFLGKQVKHAIIDDLRHDSIFLNDPELTLVTLSTGIRHVLEGEAANLIIKRVFLQLDQIYCVEMKVID